MTDKATLYFGSLLHDIGKVVYRGISERGNHSALGAQFISHDVAALNDSFSGEAGQVIVDQIRFHHARELKNATDLPDNSLAYITYFADNISAGMDRKSEDDEDVAASFDKKANLQKIFNVLLGHHDTNSIPHDDYNIIREDLKKNLSILTIDEDEINSLLNILEALTDAIPSSTNKAELIDVSLYDHAKTTAAIAACIYDFLAEQGITDYRTALFGGDASKDYYAKQMFLLYSFDMSGIQSFIYNISGSGALKQLRARSLYLEILLESIADELLAKLNLCRANLLYSGGGHAYLILPNTQAVKKAVARFNEEIERWLLEHYRTDLYLASAYVECSADDLMNKGDDKQRYPQLYATLSKRLSDAKASRYSANIIKELNFGPSRKQDHERECTECHRSDLTINSDGKCELCASLGAISGELVKKDVFVIQEDERATNKNDATRPALVVPFNAHFSTYTRDEYLDDRPKALRIYTKNQWDTGDVLATHIWMGDYTAKVDNNDIASYAEAGTTLECGHGVKRLGVLRADVDNLGTLFANGVPSEKASISRTATLSRALSRFFKLKINEILASGQYRLQVIYSGGDDLFILGNWSDVIYAAVDIKKALDEFTGNGVLTISAGIGVFDEKYPLARMASITGSLEDAAKLYVDKTTGCTKNAVALWSKDRVFSWNNFIENVLPRMHELSALFSNAEKGSSFIYKMLTLLRNYDDVASAPRLAYLLARSFEGSDKDTQEQCRQIYEWASNENERLVLITALEWCVYSNRERS